MSGYIKTEMFCGPIISQNPSVEVDQKWNIFCFEFYDSLTHMWMHFNFVHIVCLLVIGKKTL